MSRAAPVSPCTALTLRAFGQPLAALALRTHNPPTDDLLRPYPVLADFVAKSISGLRNVQRSVHG